MANETTPRSFKDYIYLVFTGICMGAADVVPGVSGGTMAFIMGVYEELLAAIKSINLKFFRLLLRFDIKGIFAHVPWKFLVALLGGIALAILSLAHFITWALAEHSDRLYAFFFGLIVASVLALIPQVRWRATVAVGLVAGTALGWFIVGLVPMDMPHVAPYLFFSGMIAIMAMILPGISGSFILLILGQYEHIMHAVKDFQLEVIAVVGAGAALGIMGFSRVLSWLLNKFHDVTLAVLIGFMIGSLRKIWPFREVTDSFVKEDGEVIALAEKLQWPAADAEIWGPALGLAILGFLTISIIDHVHTQSNPLIKLFRRKSS